MPAVVNALVRRNLFAGILLVALAQTTTALAQPTTSFASNQFFTIEQDAHAPVVLILSEPADQEIVVIIDALESGTANCGADFSCGTRIATFSPGEVSAIAYVGIYSDTIAEDPETIPLVILDNDGLYNIGDPSGANLIIVWLRSGIYGYRRWPPRSTARARRS
jgi:hypothetical protein